MPVAVLDDGRRISWAEYGRPAGAPLVVLHGTPGSRLQFRFLHEPADAAGVRVVAPERPGYGRSDPVRGGTAFPRYADDVRQLLDRLELERVTLAGASGGGGFAVAVAVAHPERVERLLLVSAAVPAPRAVLTGMSPQVRAMLFLAEHAPWLAGKLMAASLSADLDSATARWARRRMPVGDRRVLADPGRRARLAEDFAEALRQGPAAAVDDLRVSRRAPSGAEVDRLRVDTVLLHGPEDTNAPIGIARWVASRVPGARLVELPDAGHLSAVEQPELILQLVRPLRG